MLRLHRAARAFLGWAFLASCACAAAQETKTETKAIEPEKVELGRPVDFEQDIFPILDANCIACHNLAIKENGLNLEDYANLIKGGKRGTPIVAKDPEKSLLYQVATRGTAPAMPPLPNKVEAKALTPRELGLLRQWILEGAAGSEGEGMAEIEWQSLPANLRAIYAVAVSPDGQYAACGRANQITIYHIPTQTIVARLVDPNLAPLTRNDRPMYGDAPAHRDFVHALAFHPEGKLLASGDYRAVKLWKRREFAPLFAVPASAGDAAAAAGTNGVTALAVSADRQFAVSGGADGSVKILSPKDGRVVRELAGAVAAATPEAAASQRITGVSVSADGQRVAACTAGGLIRIWNAADGALSGRIDAPVGLSSLTFAQEGKQLVTGGGDNLLRIWQAPGAAPKSLFELPQPASVLATTLDRKRAAVARGRAVVVFDTATGESAFTSPEHPGEVTAAQFNGNGQKLIVATADQAVVYDLAAGSATTLPTSGTLSAAALDPQGNLAVTGTATGTATIWKLDLPAARPLGKNDGIAAAVLAVSPNGARIATAGVVENQHVLVVRNVSDGGVAAVLRGHEGAVTAAAFSPDNNSLASGSDDKTARVWKIDGAQETAKYSAHAAAVTAVAWAPDGQSIVSGSADNALKQWKAADATEIRDYAGHTGAIRGVAVLPNGQIVSGSADQTIRVWNPGDGSVIRTIGHGQEIVAIDVRRDGERIAAAGVDGPVTIYNTGDGNLAATLDGLGRPARFARFSADGSRVVAGSQERLAAWDAANGLLLESSAVAGGLAAAAFVDANRNLVVARGDQSLEAAALRFERALPKVDSALVELIWNPGGDAIFAAYANGDLRRFHAGNGEPQFHTNHGARILDLAMHADGSLLATAGENQTVRVWNAGNGGEASRTLDQYGSAVTSVAFTTDAQRVVAGTAAGEVRVRRRENGDFEQAYRGHEGAVLAVAATNETVLSLAADKRLQAWPIAALRSIPGHNQPVTSLVLFPQGGNQVVSGSSDNTVRIWNIDNGQQVKSFSLDQPVTAVAVRPDGQQIAAAGANQLARIWNNGNNQVVAELKGDHRHQGKVAELTADDGDAKAIVQQAAAAVTAAETDLKAKTDAAATAETAKANAERAAKGTEEKVKEAETKLADAKKALEGNMNDDGLKKAVADREKDLNDLKAEFQRLTDAAAGAARASAQAQKSVADATAALEARKARSAEAVAAAQRADEALKAAQAAIPATEKPIRSLAFSVDGKLIATAGDDGLIHTWNTTDGRGVEAAGGEGGAVSCVAFGTEGVVLSGRTSGTVQAWDTVPAWEYAGVLGPKPETPLELRGSPLAGRVLCLAFSYDGKLLATGGGDPSRSGELILWNLENGTPLRTLPDAHSDTVFGVEFSRDGRYVLSGGADKFVKIHEVATGTLFRSFEGHTHHVMDVSWKSDGTLVASAGADNAIKIWNVEAGEQARTITGYTKQVTSLAFVGRGPEVISCGGDATVRFHRADNGNNFRNFGGARDYMYSVAATPDGRWIVAGGEEGVLRVWNAQNAQVVGTFDPPASPNQQAAK